MRDAVRMDEICLRAVARLRIVDDGGLPLVQRRVQRVLPSSADLSSKRGKPADSSACRSRRMVRVVTAHSDASSSMVTPAPRARSISRRIVHCRMTSAFRGTPDSTTINAEYAELAEKSTLRVPRVLRELFRD